MASRALDAPAPPDVARRVRAALAYAHIDVKASGEKVGIPKDTMTRIVSPTNPRGAHSRDELELVADKTGVPLDFLLHGWEHIEEADVAEKVEALEHKLTALRAELIQIAAGNLEQMRQLLAQLDTDRQRGRGGGAKP